MSAAHTLGPLVPAANYPHGLSMLCVHDGSGWRPVADCSVVAGGSDVAQANARRLSACWNACAGISTEALDDEAPRKLLEDRDQLLAERNELLAALEYHQKQTRPIQRTIDAIAMAKGKPA